MGRRTRRVALAAAVLVYVSAVRPRLLGWGANVRERAGALPGDDLVHARWQTTRGVDVCAPREDVWPWLVQMGYGRGGWYSFDRVERAAGAGDFAEGRSATRVVPELQGLAVGDSVALSPNGGFRVAVLEPPSALVLHYRMNPFTAAPWKEGDPAMFDWTWAFVLTPVDDHSCRLVARVRADYRPSWLSVPIASLLEPVHFVMERKMLRTIARRAPAQPIASVASLNQ